MKTFKIKRLILVVSLGMHIFVNAQVTNNQLYFLLGEFDFTAKQLDVEGNVVYFEEVKKVDKGEGEKQLIYHDKFALNSGYLLQYISQSPSVMASYKMAYNEDTLLQGYTRALQYSSGQQMLDEYLIKYNANNFPNSIQPKNVSPNASTASKVFDYYNEKRISMPVSKKPNTVEFEILESTKLTLLEFKNDQLMLKDYHDDFKHTIDSFVYYPNTNKIHYIYSTKEDFNKKFDQTTYEIEVFMYKNHSTIPYKEFSVYIDGSDYDHITLTTYIYNEKDEISSSTRTRYSPSTIDSEIRAYETYNTTNQYDERGNWIEKKESKIGYTNTTTIWSRAYKYSDETVTGKL